MRSDDLGKFVLRVALGVLILLHGIAKIHGGVGPIASMLASHGLPSAMAYLVFIGEIIAPVLLIVGVYTRLAAWIVVVNMLFAIYLAHMGMLWGLSKNGGWVLELQGMFLFAALAVAFMGAGRFSIAGNGGKLN